MVEKLNDYETTYIVRPTLDEDGVDKVSQYVDEYIKGVGGIIESTEKKGRRRLAYEVDKMRDGFYVFTVFKTKPETVAQIKRMMSLSEDIIRSLILIRPKEAIENP